MVDGRPAPPGSTLANSEIWQGFMDLPPGPCTVQLRARDGDGEVICTATEPFNITADTTSKVDIVLICDVSFQAPVGMLDVDGTFSFNVGNFCPDLFVLNCHDSTPAEQDIGIGVLVAVTGCEVRFRDGDSTCGQSCDPQTCTATPEGIDCVPGPDPGVSTTITCVNGTIDCDGNPATPDTSCTINGDNLGTLPEGLDGVIPCTSDADCLAATGSADVVCDTVAGTCDFSAANPNLNSDFFAACIPPPLGGIPGAVMTCTAVTTDGDLDCDKTKVVSVTTCPGDGGPCDPFAIPPPPDCTGNPDGNVCTIDVCDASSGTAVCDSSQFVPAGGGFCTDDTICPGSLGLCDGAGNCAFFGCVTDADCDDGNDCTFPGPGTCDPVPCGACNASTDEPSGTSCNGGTGTCDGAGTCIDNCGGVDCTDPGGENECTQNLCDNTTNPGTCSNPPELAGIPCNGGIGVCDGTGICNSSGVDFPPISLDIDLGCINNADLQQSILTATLTVDPSGLIPNGAFTAVLGGALTFPEPILDVVQIPVVGGVLSGDLQGLSATVLARTGATGAPVTLGPDLSGTPSTCLIGGTACDTANDVPGNGNTDCIPVGSFNPCETLIAFPTTTDLATCQSLDPPGCTPGTDCTKSDQHALNGFCITGPLVLPLESQVAVYTAGASGETMRFGFDDQNTAATLSGGLYTMPPPVFANPLGPNGLRLIASGLAVAIECVMAVEVGDPLTDPVELGVTPDSLLLGDGVYLIP